MSGIEQTTRKQHQIHLHLGVPMAEAGCDLYFPCEQGLFMEFKRSRGHFIS